MPIDTSMYGRNKLKSIWDYEAELDASALTKQQLSSNALNMSADQQKLGEYERSMKEQGQIRNVLAGTKTPEEAINVLRSFGTASSLSHADAIEKNMIARRAQETQSAKGQVEITAAQHKLLQDVVGVIQQRPDQATAMAMLDRWEGLTKTSAGEFRQLFASVGENPEALKKLAAGIAVHAEKLLPKASNINLGGSEGFYSTDPVTNMVRPMGETPRTQTQESIATNERMAAEGAANRGVTLRGQDLTDTRQRDLADITKGAANDAKKQLTETPDGFVLVNKTTNEVTPLKTPTGEPVRSNAQAVKMEGAFNADRASLTGTKAGLDRLKEAAQTLKDHPGLGGITGLRGAIYDIPGTEAANAQAQFDTLKSQIGFGVLQDMRQNSKTGGALGNVSDAEGKRLEANLSALSRKQSKEEMAVNLDNIIKYVDSAEARLSDAFNMKHSQFLERKPATSTPSQTGLPDISAIDAELARRRKGK